MECRGAARRPLRSHPPLPANPAPARTLPTNRAELHRADLQLQPLERLRRLAHRPRAAALALPRIAVSRAGPRSCGCSREWAVSDESESSSHRSGVATGAPGLARTAYAPPRRAARTRCASCPRRSARRAWRSERRGQVVRVVRGDPLPHGVGERPRLVPARVAAQRRDHVQPARSAGHRERHQADFAQQLAGSAGAGADVCEVGPLGRVEVEDEPVGLARSSTRAGQKCGVTQFWPARKTSVAVWSTTAIDVSPSRFFTVTRGIQSGKWAAAF